MSRSSKSSKRLKKHLEYIDRNLFKRLEKFENKYYDDMSKLRGEYNKKYYDSGDFKLTKDQIKSYDTKTDELFTKLKNKIKKSNNLRKNLRKRISRI